jgi:hypothetical protein
MEIIDLTDILAPQVVDLTEVFVEPAPMHDWVLCSNCAGPVEAVLLRDHGARSIKLERNTRTPYWDGPVLASESHIDFRSIDRSAKHAEDKLAKLLTGPEGTRIIRTVAAQAMQQAQHGRATSEMIFQQDPKLAVQIQAQLQPVYANARNETRAEVKRQTKKT